MKTLNKSFTSSFQGSLSEPNDENRAGSCYRKIGRTRSHKANEMLNSNLNNGYKNRDKSSIETAKGIDFNHPKTEIQSKFDENKMLREKTDSQKEEIKTIKHPNNRKIISPRIIETHKEYCESITHK